MLEYDLCFIDNIEESTDNRQAKAHFLKINAEDFGQPHEGFVFVDSLTFKHTTSDLPGDNFHASSPDSPFKTKSVTECGAMLERLAADTDDSVLHTCFAIFDDRSLQDGSVVLVQTVDDVLEEMRCVPEIALGKLLQYMIGDADY